MAMMAVTTAGLWGIAVARRGVVEHAGAVFRLGTAERARSLESVLAAARADLVFLAGSAPLSDLGAALNSERPDEIRWRRIWAEAGLILFLRAHPEIAHLIITSRPQEATHEEAIIAAGRRGGVPVAWRPSGASALSAGAIFGEVDLQGADASSGRARLIAGLDVAALIASRIAPEEDTACTIRGPGGNALGSIDRIADAPDPGSGRTLRAEAVMEVAGWSREGPWILSCARPEASAIGVLTPLVNRYRLTLGLHLAAMTLTAVIGVLAMRQIRRREHMEWRAIEAIRLREIERQLFHSERLATLGRLAAGFAHEINNPLEGVYNYLHLAAAAAGRGDMDDVRRRLDQVRDGLGRVSAVVRRILDHSIPEAGGRARVDLSAAVAQAVDLVRSRKEFEGIRFDVSTGAMDSDVAGDPVLIGQVLLNVLLNACEAQPTGGEVRIRLHRQGEAVHVEVADRGPGVSPQDAARIFEPFFSTKGSTGLGLSICEAIVRQHGGDLSIRDRAGGGAVLRLRLPTAPPGEGKAA